MFNEITMHIILKGENSMGEDVDMLLTDEAFSERNWVSLIINNVPFEVYVPDLQRALAAFRYPTPDEIENNRPLNPPQIDAPPMVAKGI